MAVRNTRALTNTQWATWLRQTAALFKKVDDRIQEGGLIAMTHARDHGDARRMLDLVQIMGQSTRVQGFLVWVNMFSPIRITIGKEKTTVKMLKQSDKDYVAFDLAGAETRPFWTLEEAAERVPQPLSMAGFLKTIGGYKAKFEKAKAGEKGSIEGDVTSLDRLIADTMAAATREKVQLEAELLAKQKPTPIIPAATPEGTPSAEQIAAQAQRIASEINAAGQ
jgi:hypothetical protein